MDRGDEMNILLVDDHPENLLTLESVLSDLGQNLVKAKSGRAALKEVLECDFAVMLMDVQMPGMNGFETASLIHARQRSQYTPILFLTAFNKTEAHVSAGYSAGAVDYVVKPFVPEILRAKVSAFVELARKSQELEEEVCKRTSAEREVMRLNEELEQRVKQRTSELQMTNRRLKREIAERKLAQYEITRHQRAIEALNQRLQRAMTETHHRVKNNLQVIAAMVELQCTDNKEYIGLEDLRKLGIHIHTLAAVHDLLTQEAKDDGEAHHIPARLVLVKLIDMLQRTADPRRICYDIADARLSARQGTALALIVNELLSNALKYGRGDIEVGLTVQRKNAILGVHDEGPGFPVGFNPIEAANTGLELVHTLSEWDLGAKISFSNRKSGGGSVKITIPLTDEFVSSPS
jgi:two-component sensor histidine kinase